MVAFEVFSRTTSRRCSRSGPSRRPAAGCRGAGAVRGEGTEGRGRAPRRPRGGRTSVLPRPERGTDRRSTHARRQPVDHHRRRVRTRSPVCPPRRCRKRRGAPQAQRGGRRLASRRPRTPPRAGPSAARRASAVGAELVVAQRPTAEADGRVGADRAVSAAGSVKRWWPRSRQRRHDRRQRGSRPRRAPGRAARVRKRSSAERSVARRPSSVSPRPAAQRTVTTTAKRARVEELLAIGLLGLRPRTSARRRARRGSRRCRRGRPRRRSQEHAVAAQRGEVPAASVADRLPVGRPASRALGSRP